MQRVFALYGEDTPDAKAIRHERSRIEELRQRVAKEFERARALLGEGEPRSAARDAGADRLSAHIAAIEIHYLAFADDAELLLDALDAGDRATFKFLSPALNQRQDRIDAEIDAYRRTTAEMAQASVEIADTNERQALNINGALSVLAAIIGLGFATLVTRSLVARVRRLVAGVRAVEEGDLDTSVTVTSNDEVSRLTGSFNVMVGELRLKERIKETFGSYMDPRIVASLLEHPEFSEPGGEKREMSVLFVDLKGFTSISEQLSPDELVRMINDYYSLMTEPVGGNKGVVDKYIGDAVMAYWGPPFTEPTEHAALACRAAYQAVGKLGEFRRDVAQQLGPDGPKLDIDIRIGVSSGDMVVGTIGSKVSKNYTVMGDPVNLGSRLEGANKAYGTRILIADRTRQLAGDAITAREIDMIRVKGKNEPIRVFELTGVDGSEPTVRPDLAARFEAGLQAYRDCDWGGAEAAFRDCLDLVPDDSPSQTFLTRVRHLRDEPPPTGWDGVWRFETK